MGNWKGFSTEGHGSIVDLPQIGGGPLSVPEPAMVASYYQKIFDGWENISFIKADLNDLRNQSENVVIIDGKDFLYQYYSLLCEEYSNDVESVFFQVENQAVEHLNKLREKRKDVILGRIEEISSKLDEAEKNVRIAKNAKDNWWYINALGAKTYHRWLWKDEYGHDWYYYNDLQKTNEPRVEELSNIKAFLFNLRSNYPDSNDIKYE